MKKYSMTPMSRKSIKPQAPASNPPQSSRFSIAPDDEVKKRDVRVIRDKNYRQTCIENIHRFLTENEYDGQASVKSLQNPSNKDFQSIFKFIFSYIDDYDYSGRFEEDVVTILRNLRYPYSGEITKSQLSAITPHTWPVVLSMLSWLVDLLVACSSIIEREKNKNTVERYFFDFVSSAYLKYMDGDEDDADLEEGFEKNVSAIYSEIFKEVDEKKLYLNSLKEKIEEVKRGFEDKDDLEKKKECLSEDLNGLILSEKQLDSKKNKYQNAIFKITEEVKAIEEEIEYLKAEHSKLRTIVDNQQIKPEDVKNLNKEKVELYKELEKITPEKEKALMREKELKSQLQEIIEEYERYIFDFGNMRPDLSFKIIKDSDKFFIYNKKISDIRKILENEVSSKKNSVENCKINVDLISTNLSEKKSTLKELEERYEYFSNRLNMTGELYLNKKQLSEEEQRRNKSEMDKLENELLRLNIESDSALLISEQNLQKAKISIDRFKDTVKMERAEINNILCDFYTFYENYSKLLEKANQEIRKLQN